MAMTCGYTSKKFTLLPNWTNTAKSLIFSYMALRHTFWNSKLKMVGRRGCKTYNTKEVKKEQKDEPTEYATEDTADEEKNRNPRFSGYSCRQSVTFNFF